MKKDTPFITIVLMLISKGHPLNSSYKLMQFIERKLQIIESNEILDAIKQNGYADFGVVNGIHCYNLNSLGSEFIDKNYDNAIGILLKQYPEEEEIIKTLFESYNNR